MTTGSDPAPMPAGPPEAAAADRSSLSQRAGRALLSLVPFALIALGWDALAHSGRLNPSLFPPVETVLATTWRMTLSGQLLLHALYTLYRLWAGFLIAAAIGVPMGMAMARSRSAELLLSPVVAALLPIPALAWVPLFILWFGLGDRATILLAAFASTLPVAVNTWTGVKTVNEVWIRAALSMRTRGASLFRRVVLPASLPFLLAGFRIGFAQAWRAIVAGEMIAATARGLGVMIFTAREFLNTDVMLAGVIMIGVIGMIFERAMFQSIEDHTVVRWGMVRKTGP